MTFRRKCRSAGISDACAVGPNRVWLKSPIVIFQASQPSLQRTILKVNATLEKDKDRLNNEKKVDELNQPKVFIYRQKTIRLLSLTIPIAI